MYKVFYFEFGVLSMSDSTILFHELEYKCLLNRSIDKLSVWFNLPELRKVIKHYHTLRYIPVVIVYLICMYLNKYLLQWRFKFAYREIYSRFEVNVTLPQYACTIISTNLWNRFETFMDDIRCDSSHKSCNESLKKHIGQNLVGLSPNMNKILHTLKIRCIKLTSTDKYPEFTLIRMSKKIDYMLTYVLVISTCNKTRSYCLKKQYTQKHYTKQSDILIVSKIFFRIKRWWKKREKLCIKVIVCNENDTQIWLNDTSEYKLFKQ